MQYRSKVAARPACRCSGKGFTGPDAAKLAAESRHEAAVELLLDRGADIEEKDKNSQTPLHLAIRSGLDLMVELLLR